MRNLMGPAIFALCWANDSRSEGNPLLYSWGNNTSGQLGLGSEISKAIPCQVEDLKKESIKSIFSSGHCNCSAAINNFGSIFTWGNGLDGILAHNSGDSNVLIPTKVNLEGVFSKISIGGGHMAGLTIDGKIVTWGLDDCGQCGHEVIKQTVDPRAFRPRLLKGKAPGLVKGEVENYKIVDVSCGKFFTVALTENGKVFTWGAGREYGLGHGNRENCKQPTQVKALDGVFIKKIICGRNFVLCLDKDGNLYSWGNNDYGQLGIGVNDKFCHSPVKIRGITDVVDVACGDFHVLALNKFGEVYSWGMGGDGQLGHGNYSNQSSPCLINGLPKTALVSCGGGHSGFITQNFELFMVGRGADGQLGRQGKIESIASNRNLPVKVDYFNSFRVLQVTGGAHHTLALVIDK